MDGLVFRDGVLVLAVFAHVLRLTPVSESICLDTVKTSRLSIRRLLRELCGECAPRSTTLGVAKGVRVPSERTEFKGPLDSSVGERISK